jgi:hypothetical protein
MRGDITALGMRDLRSALGWRGGGGGGGGGAAAVLLRTLGRRLRLILNPADHGGKEGEFGR